MIYLNFFYKNVIIWIQWILTLIPSPTLAILLYNWNIEYKLLFWMEMLHDLSAYIPKAILL